MKNGLLKRGLLKGLAAAVLATSCGIDTGRSVKPVYETPQVVQEQKIGLIESYFLKTGDLQGSIELANTRINSVGKTLEQTVSEEGVDNTINGFSAAGKTAQVDPITVDYDARIADYNGDRIVDFTDFFRFADNFGTNNEEYNLVGSNLIDFDDFFAIADQFGKPYNRRPKIFDLQSNHGLNVFVGDEVVFNAIADDKEGDGLSINWLIRKQGEEDDEEVNGGVLRRVFDEPGTYNIFVKASDIPFGAQSNELSRTLNVRHSSPILSLPDEISFAQYDKAANNGEGATEGNTRRLNLDDSVSDPRFNDSQLTWTIDDNSVENNQFTFWPRESFWYSYTEKALHLEREGNELVINPVTNYNSVDYGVRYVNFNVTNPDGRSASKRVKVNVVRTPEFDDWYDDVVTGGGWDKPPRYFYIWTGNGRSEDGEWPLSEGRGPISTQEEIGHFERVAQMVPQVSDFFEPLEIRYTNSWDEWIANRDKGAILAYISNYTTAGSTIVENSSQGVYKWVDFGLRPLNRNSRFFPVSIHEILDHGVGMDHPSGDGGTLRDITIFSGGNRLNYVPNKDKAIIDSFYETKQY